MLIPKVKEYPMQLIYSDQFNNLEYESSFGSGTIKITVNWRPDVETADSRIELFGVQVRAFFGNATLQQAVDKAVEFLWQVGNTCRNCNFID